MAITNYTELKTAVADWLNRADLTDQIPDFISLAESTLNDVMRSSFMSLSGTVPLTNGRATLPSDVLELIFVQVENTPAEPIEQTTPQQLLMLRRARTKAAGNPRFFAIVGRDILVTPSPVGSLSIELDYYAKIPSLSDAVATNWLLQEAPHVYLYTALLHATPFLMDDARYVVFQNAVSQQVMSAVKSSQTLSFDDVKAAGFSLKSPTDAINTTQNVPNPTASV